MKELIRKKFMQIISDFSLKGLDSETDQLSTDSNTHGGNNFLNISVIFLEAKRWKR